MGNLQIQAVDLSRKEVAWAVGSIMMATSAALPIADGAPLLAAILRSPFVMLGLAISGGWVTLLWFALLLARVTLVGQNAGIWS